MKTSVRIALLCSLLAAGSAAPSAATLASDDLIEHGDPNVDGYKFYEEKAKTILKEAGSKVWDAADAAYKSGFHQFAVEQAQRAIAFNPDQKDAREFLKYTKKNEKWVQDADAFENMPRQNQRASNRTGAKEGDESFNARIKKWEDEYLKKANVFVAERYAQLGDACAGKGFKEQAKRGWEASIRLDPQNSRARKGLGYKKLGKIWITDKQEQAMKDAAKGRVVDEKELTTWEDLLGGKKLQKVESKHFRIESPYDTEELLEYARAAETAYAYYLADFGYDVATDLWDRHGVFVVMHDDDQWNKFVDRFGGRDKEFIRQLSGCGAGPLTAGVRTSSGGTMEQRRDQIVHKTVHWLNESIWRTNDRAWIDEGLGYYYTLKVLESCLTFCVALKKGDYANPKDEGGLKDWGKVENWKPLMREQVAAKNDIPFRTLINQPITQLEFHATVKAWSMIEWMMDHDRDRLMDLLERLKAHDQGQEEVIQGLFGKGLEEIEQEWQKYVLRAY